MNPPGGAGPWDPWRPFGDAAWAQVLGGGGSGFAPPGAGLDGLAAWYRGVSEALQDAMRVAPSDPDACRRRLEAFATAFFTGAGLGGAAPAPWAGLAPFGPGTAPAAEAVPGATVSAAAVGPAREHQRRAAALAAALASLAAARLSLSPLLAEAALAAASAFAARATAGRPLGARAAFELWIECAEGAWLELAHGEAWCAAQARAFDAALAVVACQQEIAEHAARLAGVPGRREIDQLHRRVRSLERGRE